MNDVNGFGGTVIQVVVHPSALPPWRLTCFGGTVIQVVVHPMNVAAGASNCFGGTVIQVIVHLEMLTIPSTLVSEVR